MRVPPFTTSRKACLMTGHRSGSDTWWDNGASRGRSQKTSLVASGIISFTERSVKSAKSVKSVIPLVLFCRSFPKFPGVLFPKNRGSLGKEPSSDRGAIRDIGSIRRIRNPFGLVFSFGQPGARSSLCTRSVSAVSAQCQLFRRPPTAPSRNSSKNPVSP